MLTDPQHFTEILDAIADSVVWVNVYGKIEGCNLAFATLVGHSRQALLQLPLSQILSLQPQEQALGQSLHPLFFAAAGVSCGSGRYAIKQRDRWHPVDLTWVQISHNDQAPCTVLTLRSAPQWLTEPTYHDPLTGLANRAFVMQWLGDHVGSSCTDVSMVLVLSIERFKVINDSLGYAVGDRLLVAIAQRLAQYLSPDDILARLNGDEFCILAVSPTHPELTLIDKLQHSMGQPFIIGSHSVLITLSIGVLTNIALYQNANDILRDAENAMYRAKSKGRGRYEVFQAALHRPSTAQLQLENDLQQAIESEQFVLHYQPVVSIRNQQRLLGFEALVRWCHPERGIVSPVEFIPLAEETGLIVPLGWWVLRQACLQLKEWQMRFESAKSLFVSVNISGRQFVQPDLVEQIQRILEDIELSPSCLKLEITESMLIDRVDAVIALLDRLKALGVQISVDDFGTGYSSLGYLNRFPIDTLKIDRSFVENVETDPEKLEIVKTIVMLAWNLGMDVVAEGVENQKQLHQLKALQCESGQGYFFAKPLDVSAATCYLVDGPHTST